MNPAPNLILIGPMGAGKTSIGRRLAERFGLRFVDLDRDIEIEAGRKIPEIFFDRRRSGVPATGARAFGRATAGPRYADRHRRRRGAGPG